MSTQLIFLWIRLILFLLLLCLNKRLPHTNVLLHLHLLISSPAGVAGLSSVTIVTAAHFVSFSIICQNSAFLSRCSTEPQRRKDFFRKKVTLSPSAACAQPAYCRIPNAYFSTITEIFPSLHLHKGMTAKFTWQCNYLCVWTRCQQSVRKESVG